MKRNKKEKLEKDKRENKAAPKDAAEGNIQENKKGNQPGKSHMDVQVEGDTYDRDLRDDVGNPEDGPSNKSSESTGHSRRGTNPHSDNRKK